MNKSYGGLCNRAKANGADLGALWKQARASVGSSHELPNRTSRSTKRIQSKFSPGAGKITFTKNDPPPRNFLVRDMLIAGKVTVLAGFGGVSKTQAVINLALSVALGNTFCGHESSTGRSILVFAEEDRAEGVRRIQAEMRYHDFSQTEVDKASDSVYVYGMAGEDVRLTIGGPDGIIPTCVATEIIELAGAIGDVKLIALDHIGLFHGGDFNAREDASLTMRVATQIAKETGAAVVILAHSPKGSAKDDKSSAAQVFGSTAFVDQSRAAWVMRSMQPEEAKQLGVHSTAAESYVSLTIVKSNYTATGGIYWFKRESYDQVGLLLYSELQPPPKLYGAEFKCKKNIVNLVRKNSGKYTKTRFRDLYSGKRETIGLSKAKLELAIDDLINEGTLRLVKPTEEQRAAHNLTKQMNTVLVPGDINDYL